MAYLTVGLSNMDKQTPKGLLQENAISDQYCRSWIVGCATNVQMDHRSAAQLARGFSQPIARPLPIQPTQADRISGESSTASAGGGSRLKFERLRESGRRFLSSQPIEAFIGESIFHPTGAWPANLWL
jgi:hypothetical protein